MSAGRAISTAHRQHGADAVTFIEGDATRLGTYGIHDVEFFLDIGCFHGMSDRQRAALAGGITEAATGSATLLLVAFRPARRVILPRAASESDFVSAFRQWDLADASPVDPHFIPRPFRSVAPVSYRLRRRV